jgi:hypothetical protein
MNFVRAMLYGVVVLALCGATAPALGHVKKAPPNQAAGKAIKKQASVFDSDGYRLVSPNSTMRCAQTLRGTLDCKE